MPYRIFRMGTLSCSEGKGHTFESCRVRHFGTVRSGHMGYVSAEQTAFAMSGRLVLAAALKLISQGRDHAMDNPYILDRQPF